MELGLEFVCFIENSLKSRCEMFKHSNGGKRHVLSKAKGSGISFVGISSFGHNFVSCEATDKFTDYRLWSARQSYPSIVSDHNNLGDRPKVL